VPTPTHILVVDDEPDLALLVRQKFRRRIRAEDFAFHFAQDGVEALDVMAANPQIQVALVDLNMPRMDGLTLLEHLGKTAKQRPLRAVVVTAYGDMENIRAAMNRGAFDFLPKPIDLSDLEITVDKAVEEAEQEARGRLARSTFGRYLSPEVVETLLADPEALRLGGSRRTVTILMSDIRGFSALAEALEPEQVVEILNVYLGAMADVIAEHDGTINEFIGDGIFVLFGAPVEREDCAGQAIACALAMQNAMGSVNARLASFGIAPLRMGIGLHTGEVIVGNIGSERRAKYGVVGSHVNLAARIESYTVGGQVLASAATVEDAKAEVQVAREMRVSVKGFPAPIPVCDVTGIGAPYGLTLVPDEDAPVTLPAPLPFGYARIDGVMLTGDRADAELVALSRLAAVFRTTTPDGLAPLENLQLYLPAPEADPESDLQTVYGKVIDLEGGLVTVTFTALPPAAARTVEHLLEGAR
ncbi:MAG: adenylate/guanylate cyclase domain-containing protein, partial [Bacteroidota bacterium]